MIDLNTPDPTWSLQYIPGIIPYYLYNFLATV